MADKKVLYTCKLQSHHIVVCKVIIKVAPLNSRAKVFTMLIIMIMSIIIIVYAPNVRSAKIKNFCKSQILLNWPKKSVKLIEFGFWLK